MDNRELRTGRWNIRPIGPFSILSFPFPVFHFLLTTARGPYPLPRTAGITSSANP